jgi:tetratricopeptide (TPR) repeat protein/tRNA A-37 threonylcarbamoyl transferase component Bud32
MSTPSPSADRNLIFGLLALQMDFVTREQLLEAMSAWMLAKHLSLGDILCGRGVLAEDERQVLDLALRKHIQRHGGDPQASLAALRVEPAMREELHRLNDADVQASIAVLQTTPPISASPPGNEPEKADAVTMSQGSTSFSATLRLRRLHAHAKGGLGEVFVALDEKLRREVALKEILGGFADHPESRARFVREAEITGNLEHPGVVPVYGLGAYADGRPFYVMRFIRGLSMQDALERFHQADRDSRRDPGARSLALRDLLGRFVTVCNAVAYAHSRGVIHRDLKPANVMLGEYGETLVVDWGLARLFETREGEQTTADQPVLAGSGTVATRMGQVVGTPAFMPPEQAAARLDRVGPHSDVFSLGATLYTLLTGTAPYTGTDALGQAVRAEVVPARQRKASVPPALEAVCARAMAVKPGERYPSASALAEDVQRWLADEPVSAYREPWSVRVGRWLRRHKTLAASTAAVLLASLVIGGFAAWRLEQQAVRQRRGVETALEEVARLQKQERWAEAQVALNGAESRLEKGGPKDLRARLEQARSDLDLVARLDAIRLKRAIWTKDGFDRAGADQSYEDAFREAGMGEPGGDTAEAAAWIHNSAVSDALIASVDDWTICAKKRERRDWLLEVARQADPDPWRDRARDPALWDNKAAVARLLGESAAAKQSPKLLVALGTRLPTGDAERLLRRAQERHPEDFWINFTLGKALLDGQKPEEAVGYYRAALALRPRTFAVHTNLGNALREAGKTDEALAEFNKAIDLEPGMALAYTNLGNALFDKGRWDEAITACRKALDIDPGSALAHNTLGNALCTKGKVEEAIAAHRKAIQLDPELAVAYSNLGTDLSAAGKEDEAIAAWRKAIAIDPSDALAHSNLGAALYARGKADEAIAECRKAIAFDPRLVNGHINLGNALRRKGKLDEAIAACRKAIDIAPRDARAYAALGTALGDKGRLDEAIVALRKATEIDPGAAPAYSNLGKALYDKGKLDEAIAACRKAIALDARDAVAHNNLGVALRDKGKMDEAIAAARQAIAIDPGLVNAHYTLGTALVARGKTDEAIAAYRKAIEIDPRHMLAHSNLGAALSDTGKVDEAIAACRKAIAIDPRHANTHNNLGVALYAGGKTDEAIAAYRKAVEIDPRHMLAHLNLGAALSDTGKVDEAIAACRKAIDLDPKHARTWYALGNCLMARGRLIEAAAAFRKTIAIDGELAEAHCNLGHVLGRQGRFAESLESLRRGHALGAKRPDWRYPSALWVRRAERLVALDKQLPEVLSGKRVLASVAERIDLARFCATSRRYAAGVRLYEEAFTAEPTLANNLQGGHRYLAACAAALGGSGKGDAAKLDEKEKGRLRGRSLAWLRADLALRRKQLESGTPTERLAGQRALRSWRKELDLAGVRDPAALENLPESEREEWKKLWSEVAALLGNSEKSDKER